MHINSCLGPILLSIFVNSYVSGLVGVQYSIYYVSNRYKSCWKSRTAIILLGLIDVFQVAVTLYMAWLYCVTNFLNFDAVNQVALWTYIVIPLCNSISSAIAHAHMAYRLCAIWKKIDKMIFFYAAIGVVVSLGFAAGMFGMINNLSMIDVTRRVTASGAQYRYLLLTWLATRLALDAGFLGALGYSFHLRGADVDHVPSRLVRRAASAVQSGTFSTLFSLCALVSFVAWPATTIYVIFLLPGGRLSSNVVLTSVNIRAPPRRITYSETEGQVVTDDVWMDTNPSSGQVYNLSQLAEEDEVDNPRKRSTSVSSRTSNTHGPNFVRYERRVHDAK